MTPDQPRRLSKGLNQTSSDDKLAQKRPIKNLNADLKGHISQLEAVYENQSHNVSRQVSKSQLQSPLE